MIGQTIPPMLSAVVRQPITSFIRSPLNRLKTVTVIALKKAAIPTPIRALETSNIEYEVINTPDAPAIPYTNKPNTKGFFGPILSMIFPKRGLNKATNKA